jgi:peptidoglycan/LPS O-acetylase OafA/YrhL
MTTVRATAPARPPSSPARSPRLHSVTALRFFAAVAVVLVHVRFQFVSSHALRAAASFGYVGVTFFFLLSGFVLTWSWSGQSAGRFWWGRVTRIWPLNVALMLVAFTVLAASEREPGTFGKSLELLLLQAWDPHRTVYFGGNGVSWSLSCEMFFYLLFPLVVGPVARLGRRGLAALAAATAFVLVGAPVMVGSSVSADTYYWLFYVFPPYRFGEFLLGMVLARAALLGLRVRRPALSGGLATAGIAALIAAVTWLNLATGAIAGRPFVAAVAVPLFALLLLACVAAETGPRRPWLTWRPLVVLGEWSFALFLVHKPVMLLTERWGWWPPADGAASTLAFVVFLALASAVAGLLHHGVEKPVDQALRRVAWRPVARPAGG